LGDTLDKNLKIPGPYILLFVFEMSIGEYKNYHVFFSISNGIK
jgi:hypothetical protein